ncbi:rrf2 family protein, putative transcriptional regulator [Desulfocapsa sulfexigens DSM 10523]|uniref:Rrf2 family protein, putative transcriptional regulator n=1 Tax=Desulfocapsa sulfexigens (strain DSM 10523 / SB164P1) TaxID=1167006 RepID=M1NEL7_DESSD|nr:Rrf2 family transcriptional regulator [Desulfocapsa sulfexigens]AGF78149.1 rrf2 family protein, putative transcriptional regulator [Desulfocapsa sulfexigens DSM 10523]
MRLTRAGEYAVRCMMYLSHKGKGVQVSKQEIAERADIPPHFLAKIAQDLARANMIEIKQGSKGGYSLLKDPAEISLLEVVEIMIGEIFLNDCVARPVSCRVSKSCSVHRVWERARNQLRETLAGVSLAELSENDSCVPLFPVHN